MAYTAMIAVKDTSSNVLSGINQRIKVQPLSISTLLLYLLWVIQHNSVNPTTLFTTNLNFL